MKWVYGVIMPDYYSLLLDNVWIALILFIFVWIFSWAKGALGSAKLAILFAMIIVYLTFFQFRELVWIGVIIFLFAVFGKDFLARVDLKMDRP